VLGVKLGPLFLALGLCNIAAMVLILRRWGKEGVARVSASFVFKTLFASRSRVGTQAGPVGTRIAQAEGQESGPSLTPSTWRRPPPPPRPS